MLIEQDAFENDLDIDDLVIITSASRYAGIPRYALYDGHTAKTFRFRECGIKWDLALHDWVYDKIVKTNLSPMRGRSSCVLVAKGPFSEDELKQVSKHGFKYLQTIVRSQ